MTKKHLILDFAGVLIEDGAIAWFRKKFSGSEALFLKDKYCEPLDMGLYNKDDFFLKLSLLVDEPPESIFEDFLKLSKPNEATISLLPQLKEIYNLSLLSNGNSQIVGGLLKKYDLVDCFNNIYISSDISLIKPDKEIFEFVLSCLKIKPKEAIFVDDNGENVAAAQSLGIRSLHFGDSSDLEKLLTNVSR